ncbi:EthD domain-containing protein [Priestia filamentosa]|uniref:EthD domain-containing protein n=1 Tax=Priestia filamentosa TaxID=1402861 RepID=UPI000E76ECF0|nr:EthD domain-containing protein [Priestia filamentosa]RJS62847.1 hypothetical protein CJ485_24440 [Priestia filamentosa]
MSITLLAASRRRPGLTKAEYQRYLEFYHGNIARMDRGGLVTYIQNHVIDGAFGTLEDSSHQQKVADRDGVVELTFDTFPEMVAALEPAEPSAASIDGQFFAEECNNITVMSEQEEIPVSHPIPTFNPGLGIVQGVGSLKVMQYIMRNDDVFPEDFHAFWREAHEEALKQSPYAQEQLRRCVAYKRSRLNDNDGAARAHFKMVDPPVYDLVVAHWFDTIEQVGAFRQYNEALQAYSKNKFANWSKSFFVYTKQINIINDTPVTTEETKEKLKLSTK